MKVGDKVVVLKSGGDYSGCTGTIIARGPKSFNKPVVSFDEECAIRGHRCAEVPKESLLVLEAYGEVTDELLADLAVFTQPYVAKIQAAIVSHATEIAKDATLVKLLHEYVTRLETERVEHVRAVIDATKGGQELKTPSNVSTHANSYRDVIEDLLRPCWQEKEETR